MEAGRRLAFVLDQQVGLRTQSLNFERIVSADPAFEGTIVPVRYAADGGFLTRIPGVPGGVKGTLRGVAEIRSALEGKDFDAVLWATWAAKSVPDLVSRWPAYIRMDMTPIQMEEMGAHYGYSKTRARFLASLKRRATDRIYNLATHHFPWSNFVAESLEADYGIPAENITVITPGVDTELYHPDPSVKPNDGVVRVLFVGGDFERKGGDLLLRWAKERQADKSLPSFELQIVTRDESVQSGPGIVVHRGVGNDSPELIRLYQMSDVFVLPTRADCYSLVSMEAMACGLPVVVSRLGGIPDIVSEGETGYLLTPDDDEALAVALDHLVSDQELRELMGADGRRRAVGSFDSRASLGQIVSAMKTGAVLPASAAR